MAAAALVYTVIGLGGCGNDEQPSPATTSTTDVGGGSACDGHEVTVERIAGLDAFETAALLSTDELASAADVVVAQGAGDVAADALVGAPLAAVLGAPVLLVDGEAVPQATCDELWRLGATRAHAVGTGSGAPALRVALNACGPLTVDRFEGADRAETAVLVSTAVAMGSATPEVVLGPLEGAVEVERYLGPAAALAAVAREPLLLVGASSVPQATANALAALDAEQTLVAAPASAIGPDALVGLPSPERLAGGEPTELAATVVERLTASEAPPRTVAIVWVDDQALAAEAASAAALGWPVLLARRGQDELPAATAAQLAAARCGLDRVVVLGDETGVTTAAEEEIAELVASGSSTGPAILSLTAEPGQVELGGSSTLTVVVAAASSSELVAATLTITASPPAGEPSELTTEPFAVDAGQSSAIGQAVGPLDQAGAWTLHASLYGSDGQLLADGPAEGVTVTVGAAPLTGGLGTWVLGTTVGDMGAAAFVQDVVAMGARDVLLLVKGSSGIYRFDRLDEVVAQRDAAGHDFRVHAWVTCFSDDTVGGWVSPADASYRSYLLDTIITPVLGDHAPDGLVLDYVRYPGTANGDSASVTSFVADVRTLLDATRPGTILSAAVMPEPSVDAQVYGQDLAALASLTDVLMPMIYTTNYGEDAAWVEAVTAAVGAAAAGQAQIWPALQSFTDAAVQISGTQLRNEITAARSGGATGISLFRYPHTAEQVAVAQEFAW